MKAAASPLALSLLKAPEEAAQRVHITPPDPYVQPRRTETSQRSDSSPLSDLPPLLTLERSHLLICRTIKEQSSGLTSFYGIDPLT